MVSIVVHGIMGTAYRQDIVVDGGVQFNDSTKMLKDIRHFISTQYGDGTPTTGWTLSPAPSGMWLSRVERAFDANYAPGYLMVSVLIPRGQRLKDDTILNKISRAMILNHSKYINQNVIQYESDWGFLVPLSQELEGCLVPVDGAVSSYMVPSDGEVAYYEGDLSKMVLEMWSDKFARYGTVFCGKGLLAGDGEYPIVKAVAEQAKLDIRDVARKEPIIENKIDSLSQPSVRNRAEASFKENINKEPVLNKKSDGGNANSSSNAKEPIEAEQPKKKTNTMTYLIVGFLAVIALILIIISIQGNGESSNQNNVVDEPQPQYEEIEPKDDIKKTIDRNQYDNCKIDMGFASEEGNTFYWASGNLTSEYTIANDRSDKGALFYWGDTAYTSTGDYRRYHYDEWYDGGGWKKSSLFGGPNPPKCISGTNYDVAHVKIGGNWRLPTKKEFQDLIKNSTITQATENGQKGYLFTSKINGNTLFFPRVDSWQGGDVGAYWSGTLVEKDIREACYVFMTGSTAYTAKLLRCDANAIRPVCDERYTLNKTEENVSNNKSVASTEVVDNRIVINTASKLFLCLTWENVKDGGRLFYGKYEVSPPLKRRVDVVIKQAHRVGKDRYMAAYARANNEHEGSHDKLYALEKYLTGEASD